MLKGILLINLGTPDQCHPASVRRYLREFLNDPRVIDLPALIRWPLVNGVIIPFRYRKTTHAYQKIWETAGSPLSVISQQMADQLKKTLGAGYQVALGMRYGQPSIQSALNELKQCDSIAILPLFPQYSSAATGSAIEACLAVLAKEWNMPAITIKSDFYQNTGFIAAYSHLIQQHLQDKKYDLLLFSYHGLPERHINKSQCHAVCDHLSACPAVRDDNRFCYRAQCYATTQLIATQLGLQTNQYTVSFQSRLGRTPWIKPYTDLLLPELIKKGIKDLAIVCPSFVADCLETLEEVNIRAREQWRTLGGSSFTFIPCLNVSSPWIDAVADMVR